MDKDELKVCYRQVVPISVNGHERITIINPPPALGAALARAAAGISIVGRANQTDYYIEASRDAASLDAIGKQIVQRLERQKGKR